MRYTYIAQISCHNGHEMLCREGSYLAVLVPQALIFANSSDDMDILDF